MLNQKLAARCLAAKRALFDKAYSDLNARQREAVFAGSGPLLVLAGAGSGKTTVLVRRIAYLIKYGNAYRSERIPESLDESAVCEYEAAAAMLSPAELPTFLADFSEDTVRPWNILSITFTNKAANEMKARLSAMLADLPVGEGEKPASEEIWAGTFHSVCLRILRRDCSLLGYLPGFTIYDSDDTKKTVIAAMKELKIDKDALDPRACASVISRAKDSLLSPEAFAREAATERLRDAAAVYAEYEKRLRAANAMDFDDIILNTVRLLEENPEILDRYARKFRYICVDEYQDTNAAQFRLCELLSSVHKNIMVVGDDDQSIYAFRGATVENILHFDDAFPDAHIVKLEQNYRSTQNILDAANAVIAHNSARHAKKLWTEGEAGERAEIVRVPDQNAEARYLCEVIQRRKAEGGRYADNAVLYRVNAQSGSLETALMKSGIPYRVLAGTRFYDRKEIKDILAYLCLIENHGDDLRLRRIINEPKRKIGDAALDAAARIAEEEGISLFDVMKRAGDYPYLSAFAQRFLLFSGMIEELTEFSRVASVSELVERVITSTGYKKMLTDEGEEAQDRLQNLEELISGCVEYEQRSEEPSLSGYLEEISLLSDVDKYDEEADAVVLMTIHSAKGLEFSNVYLPGMEEGIFPGQKVTADPGELPEERRLAYVAITRAKKRLTMIHAKERLLYGRTTYNPPSRFLAEIPEEYVKKTDLCPALSPRAAFIGTARSYRPERRATAFPSVSPGLRPSRPTPPSFSVGDRVRHLTFGEGTVAARTDMGGDILYDVEFDTAGRRRLMGSYAKLASVK